MKTFLALRFLAVLLRIARALDKSNEMAQERMRMDYPAWKDRPKPRKAEISTPTVEQWNENFLRTQDGEN